MDKKKVIVELEFNNSKDMDKDELEKNFRAMLYGDCYTVSKFIDIKKFELVEN